MTTGDWVVEYYVEESGRVPVQQFLAELDEKALTRMMASTEQLRVRNTQAHEPLVRHIEGKIWELRRESDTNIYRIFYVFASNRRIVLLHGFPKKTQKTPRNEIEIAQRRLTAFELQEQQTH